MLPPEQYPYTLPLADGTQIVLHGVVRDLPGRRVVCRGIRQGQEVYVKLFFGGKAKRDADRDAGGVQMLTRAGIPTPALLYNGTPEQGGGRVLVFEAISDSRNAEEIWHTLPEDDPGRLALAQRLVLAVADHHRSGLVQNDMYLKNFLVRDALVMTLDGDGIRAAKSSKNMLYNLAVLLSKFPPSFDRNIVALWRSYSERVAWAYGRAVPPQLAALSMAERRSMITKYADKKVLRECTDVHVESHGGNFLAVARAYWQPQFQELFQAPESYLKEGRCTFLKQGGSATVALVEIGENKLVVKRYNPKNTFKGTLRRLRKSRARISWCNAYRLGMYEIATPRPVALIERRRGALMQAAYFITEYAEASNVINFFREDIHAPEEREQVAYAIARTLHNLFLSGIEHGDMKGTNLKVCLPSVAMIDLDAMKQHPPNGRFWRRHQRDLLRLFRNWPSGAPEQRELAAAFGQAYGDAWTGFEKSMLLHSMTGND